MKRLRMRELSKRKKIRQLRMSIVSFQFGVYIGL